MHSGKTLRFSRSFSRRFSRAIAILLFAALLVVAGLFTQSSPLAAQQRNILLVSIDGGIGPAVSEYVRAGIAAARERESAAIVLRVNTPGGLDSATREIVAAILASPIPVFVYVAPAGARAASAGTYIALASHLAGMVPGANIGAATPVRIGAPSVPGEKDGKPQTPDAMERKLVNDSVAWIRSLADIQGRNADWAEKAVREGVSLPAREAQEQKVVELLAVDLPSLLEQAEGRTMSLNGRSIVWTGANAQVEAFDPDWRIRLLAAITDPTIAYILLLVGVYGLIFEALAPGSLFPGTIGAISLIIAVYALNLMSVDAAGALLIGLGIALMIGEAVTPTFGVLGFAGAAAFAVGSVFLFTGEIPEFTLSPWLIAAATAMSAGVMAWAVGASVRATRRPLASGEADYAAGRGVIIDWQAGAGLVRFHSEIWQARGPVDLAPGASVRIHKRDGLTLLVEEAIAPSIKPGAKP